MNPQKLYTIREAREFTGLGVTSAYAEIAAGRLTALKVGSRAYLSSEEIKRYIDSLPRIGGTQVEKLCRKISMLVSNLDVIKLRDWLSLIIQCLKVIQIFERL